MLGAERREGGSGCRPYRRNVCSLRLINDGAVVADVVITGVNDAGESGGEARLTIPAGEAVTISADEIENGGGLLAGSLGDDTASGG